MDSNKNSSIRDSRPGDLFAQLPNSSVSVVPGIPQIANTGSNEGGDQQHGNIAQSSRPTYGNLADPSGDPGTLFSGPDFGHMANVDSHDPTISDLDDSSFPGAYLDLFDSDERYVDTDSYHA